MKFVLPELGEGVHEGELVKWLVKVGDQIKTDQPLCEIMTDKATVEIPSAFEGRVEGVHAKEGETVKVGQLMLSFEGHAAAEAAKGSSASVEKSAHAPAPAKTPAPAPIQTQVSKPAPAAPVTYAAAPTGGAMTSLSTDPATRPLAAPATRMLARELGVDLNRVQGSGPNGRIMKSDVETSMRGGTGAVAGKLVSWAKPIPAGGEERVAFKGLRKKISEKMRLSKDKAAHFTYVEEADATDLVKLRATAKEMGAPHGIKVTYLPFIMKAMVAALRKYPALNSHLDEEKQELVTKHYFNIGLSIQTDDGLTAPVVKNVESKGIWDLAREIDDLVKRARAKKLTQEDFQGGTITLTNAGSIGGLFATPIINFPEVAILGFNKIFRKPVVKEVNGTETVVIRDWTYFSISLDHRIVDGAVAAEFMKEFINIIENPAMLFLDGGL